MLKTLSAASVPIRFAPVQSSSGPASQAPSGFGDVLEAAQQALPLASGTGKGSPVPAGGPQAAMPKPQPAAVAPDPAAPAAAPFSQAEMVTGWAGIRLAGGTTRPNVKDAPEASSQAKSASDVPRASSGAVATTTAATPDATAAAIAQAEASQPAAPGILVVETSAEPPAPAGSATGPATGRDGSTPASAAGADDAGAAADATAKPGLAVIRPSDMASATQSLLPEMLQPAMMMAMGANSAAAARTPVPSDGGRASAGASAAAAVQAAVANVPAAASGAPTASAAGRNGGSAATGQQAAGSTAPTLSMLVDTIQRTTGLAVDRIAVSPGSSQAGTDLPTAVDGASPADQPPLDAVDPNAVAAVTDARGPLTDAGAVGAGLLASAAAPAAHPDAREVASAQGQDASAVRLGVDQRVADPMAAGPLAVDPLAAAAHPGDPQTMQVSGASAARPLPAAGGVPPSVVSQVTPAVVSLAHGGGAGGRLSLSITPEQLGQVHITVERATDGTTSIHVAAEQLGTLNILRHDQGELTRALDQAGVGQGGHNLSFSWEGGGGAMQGWAGPGDQRGEYRPAQGSKSYPVESSAIPSATATATVARGGIDLTA